MQLRTAIRWTLADAEAEFPLKSETLSKRLRSLGFQPDDDGKFLTPQICAAVYGDHQMERSRLAKEQADRVELDNRERRRELIAVEEALTIARKFIFAARQRIVASGMSDEEKNQTIAELRRLASADYSALPDDAD